MNKDLRINDVYIDALNCTDRYLFLFGGAGSGKSFFGLQKKLLRLQSERNHKFLFARKVKDTIKESVFALTKSIISDELETYDRYKINATDKSFVFLPNGNRIISAGLDDVEKMKSIAGVTGILIEEITELTFDDFTQLDLRLRGETTNYKQIIGMFNPIDKGHWLKSVVEPDNVEFQYLRDDKKAWRFPRKGVDGKEIWTTVYNTTYDDNYYIDDEYKSVMETKAAQSRNHYRVYKLGRWGTPEVSNAFFYEFKFDKHVVDGEVEIDPEEPLYMSWDFNVNPTTCTIFQKTYTGLNFIREYSEDGGTQKLVDKIAPLYKDSYFIKVCGDHSGNSRKSSSRYTDFQIIQDALELPDSSMLDIQGKNLGLKYSRDLVNAALHHIPISISKEGCPVLINDLETGEWNDKTQKIIKDRNSHTQDSGDTFRYGIACLFSIFKDIKRYAEECKEFL